MTIDLHVHTKFGSSCSYMRPQEMAKKAKQLGLDAVCITEHDVSWAAADLDNLSQEHEILVLGGVEVGTDLGHVLVYGVYQPIWSVSRAEELRRLVDQHGGAMIAAHPFRVDRFSPDREVQLAEYCSRPIFQLVDAAEVFNGRSTTKEIDFGCEVLCRLKLRGVGGSDAHAVHTIGETVTVFERPIANNSELISELKAGRFKALHRVLNRSFEGG